MILINNNKHITNSNTYESTYEVYNFLASVVSDVFKCFDLARSSSANLFARLKIGIVSNRYTNIKEHTIVLIMTDIMLHVLPNTYTKSGIIDNNNSGIIKYEESNTKGDIAARAE